MTSASWPMLTLGELTATTRPICYGVLKPGPAVPDGVPLLRIVDLAGDRVDDSAVHRISESLDKEFSRSRLVGGEVLLSIQGTIGRVAICPPRLAGANISRTIAVIQPDSRLLPEFLRYFLLYRTASHSFETGGTTRASLNISTIRDIRVPVPELDQQRHIVEILEDHLSRLDAGTGVLRRLPRRLQALQRALIDKVFMAEADARGWSVVPLEQCASDEPRSITDGPFGSNLTSAHYVPVGARVVRLQNIGDGVFKKADAFISEDHFKSLRSHEVRAGDLVVASLGEELPRAAVVPELGSSAIVKADCVRVRLRPDIDPAWVALACRSTRIKSWARTRVHGVGRQRLGVAGIKEIPIPLPDEEVRRATTGELTQALEDLDRLGMSVALGSARLAALRRSLLNAAFSGRLTGSSADVAEEVCGV